MDSHGASNNELSHLNVPCLIVCIFNLLFLAGLYEESTESYCCHFDVGIGMGGAPVARWLQPWPTDLAD